MYRFWAQNSSTNLKSIEFKFKKKKSTKMKETNWKFPFWKKMYCNVLEKMLNAKLNAPEYVENENVYQYHDKERKIAKLTFFGETENRHDILYFLKEKCFVFFLMLNCFVLKILFVLSNSKLTLCWKSMENWTFLGFQIFVLIKTQIPVQIKFYKGFFFVCVPTTRQRLKLVFFCEIFGNFDRGECKKKIAEIVKWLRK